MKNLRLKKGMKFRIITEVDNPEVDTKKGNIVKIIQVGKHLTEFEDIVTFGWFVMNNKDITDNLELIK